MILPQLFSAEDQKKTSEFFAVHIAEKYVEAALWRVEQNQVVVVVQSQQAKWHDEPSCVAAIDQVLQQLGKEAEHVKETLFALQNDWVDANGILATKKSLFQKITSELSLTAIGFVVVSEALVQHLVQLSSPQLSMFLVDISDHFLFVSFVQHGQIIKTEKVGRSDHAVSDVIEAFAHFSEKVFPSKFLLFSTSLSTEQLSNVQQQLIAHDWVSKYPFLHPPTIEIESATNVLSVVVQSGGFAIAQSRHLVSEKNHQPVIVAKSQTLPAAAPGDFGFTEMDVSTKAAAKEPAKKDDAVEKAVPMTPIVAAEEIAIDRHIQVPKQAIMEHSHDVDIHDDQVFEPKHQPHKKQNHLPFILGGVIGGLLVLGLVLFVAAQTTLKALVTLQLNTKTVAKDITLTLDPTAPQSDPSKLLLKAQIVTKQENGQKSAATTGVKLIGDKAKGTVTLFNLATDSKTFAAGTVLTAATGTQKFTLDQTATIASASSSQDSVTNSVTINPGTTTVTVTATQIGTDSNLPKNTNFTIANADSKTYSARSTNDFIGGTSREIQAVSKDDRDKLLASLKQDLMNKANQDFKTEQGSGRFIAVSNDSKVIKSTFSADVGKETDSFSLDLTIEVNGLAYQLSDLKPLALQVLSGSVPSGYQLSSADPQILSSALPKASGSAQVQLQTNINTIADPVIQIDQLKQEIAGKSQKAAEADLQQHSEISAAQIELMPKFFALFFHTLPKKTDRIDIRTGGM